MRYYDKIHSKLPIFRVKSVKIYTRQFFLHRHRLWCLWQIWGMYLSLLILTNKHTDSDPESYLNTNNAMDIKKCLQLEYTSHSWQLLTSDVSCKLHCCYLKLIKTITQLFKFKIVNEIKNWIFGHSVVKLVIFLLINICRMGLVTLMISMEVSVCVR